MWWPLLGVIGMILFVFAMIVVTAPTKLLKLQAARLIGGGLAVASLIQVIMISWEIADGRLLLSIEQMQFEAVIFVGLTMLGCVTFIVAHLWIVNIVDSPQQDSAVTGV